MSVQLMTPIELIRILQLHEGYLKREIGATAANLAMEKLSGMDLSDANLEEAKLTGTLLDRASLRRANLTKADMYFCNLYRADLREANFRGADLRGANLRGADLSYANLQDADLRTGALWAPEPGSRHIKRIRHTPEDDDASRANLLGANMKGSRMSRGAVIQVDLTGASLACAMQILPKPILQTSIFAMPTFPGRTC